MQKKANSEPKNQLRDTIRDCKRRLQAQGYGKATAMFIISRVGNSDGARRFIDGIGDDPEVGSMVYTNTEDICRKRELFDTINDARYTKWVSCRGICLSCGNCCCGLGCRCHLDTIVSRGHLSNGT